jgi:hypothetical protein
VGRLRHGSCRSTIRFTFGRIIMPRQITYSIATEYRDGFYNPTFNWGMVDRAYNYLGLYWDIKFVRVNSGARIKIIQANTNPNTNWLAWTRGFETRISPVRNFGKSDFITALITCHEFGHMCRTNGSHASSPGLMDPSASMPTGNLAPVDYYWFDVYPRTPGAKRPHEEPNRMRTYFSPPVKATGVAAEPLIDIQFGCNHKPVERAWYDFRPESWLKP